jgi:hypothetical protein
VSEHVHHRLREQHKRSHEPDRYIIKVLSQMIAGGLDDYTVMEVSGHSSTRMLARYTHPTAERENCGAGELRASDGQNLGRTRG